MSKMIQIRNVPEALHKRLKSRAAMTGVSMSDYLLAEIGKLAALPTEQELRQRLSGADPFDMSDSSAEIIRKGRDAAWTEVLVTDASVVVDLIARFQAEPIADLYI